VGSPSPECGKVRRVGFAALIAVLFLIGAQSLLLPRGIIHFVERALEIHIEGPVQPVWGKFQFLVDPLQTLWDDKIKIASGRVLVKYGLKDFLSGQLHIVISGQNVDAQLLGDWVSVAGGQAAVFKDLYADLVIGRDGIQEIRALRAESPALQFRFGEATNRQLKETHEA